MDGDNQQDRRRPPYFRYAVLGFAALLVLALGFSLIPAEQQPPAEPTPTEISRASALAEALTLRADGQQLAASRTPDGGAAAAAAEVVTLLTLHARALLAPGEVFPEPGTAAAASGAAAATPAVPAPAPSGSRTAPEVTAAKLAADLAGSGRTRLRDAGKVDGGMARLLAGAGIAQLLAAEKLAAAAGDPAAAEPAPTASEPAGATSAGTGPAGTRNPDGRGSGSTGSAGPLDSADPLDPDRRGSGSTGSAGPLDSADPLDPDRRGSGSTGPSPTPDSPTAQDLPCPAMTSGVPDAGAALARMARLEEQAVYGYQAALTRLPPGAVGPASEFLALHREQAAGARARSLADCGRPATPDPGYNLDAAFLAAPADALGRLEADILPAYGDVVSLADSPDRAWALAGLEAAARRTVDWGADPGPVPGLVLDESMLPAGPVESPPGDK